MFIKNLTEEYKIYEELKNTKVDSTVGYLIDGKWFDAWIEYIETSLLPTKKPYKDINSKLQSKKTTYKKIVLNWKDKIYLLNYNVWHKLISIYTSSLTLSLHEHKKLSAYYTPTKEDCCILNIPDSYLIHIPFKKQTLNVSFKKALESKDVTVEESSLVKKPSNITTGSLSSENTCNTLPAYNEELKHKSIIKQKPKFISLLKGLFKVPPRKKSKDSSEEIEPEEEWSDMEEISLSEGLVGIINRGSNCYINASLQCLLSIPKLVDYFLNERYKGVEEHQSKKVCNMMTKLCEKVFKDQIKLIAIKSFINMCPLGQQDAHEFLLKILFPAIQEETQPNSKQPLPNKRDLNEVIIWHKKYNTVIEKLFGGVYRNSVRCKNFGHNSVSYDSFIGISVSIAGSSLLSSLRGEMSATKLAEYNCVYCNKVSEVIKTTEIELAPRYLIFHLKRLINHAKKVKEFISYPMNLNVKEFCSDKSREIQYTLVAICIHQGEHNKGHFYSICKRNNNVNHSHNNSGTYLMIRK